MNSPLWMGGEGSPDPTALRGFKVPLNGCFGAATLQCLCRFGDFDKIYDDNQNDVVSVFIRTCRAINSLNEQDAPVSMEPLWRSLRDSVQSNRHLRRMFDGEQMDAEEFLRYMMHLLSVDERTQNLGLFDSATVRYRACVHRDCPHRKSRRFGPVEHDSTMVLKLPILRDNQYDVGQVKFIGTMMTEEFALEHIETMTCEVCKYGIDAVNNKSRPVDVAPRNNPKGMYLMREIASWPEHLIIQVLRYNKGGQRVNTTMKIEQYVEFKTAPGIVYELVSFVDHIGSTPHSGHYTANCKINETWVKFDDSMAYPQNELDELSSRNTLMFYKAMPIRYKN